ncbi:MAG: hypothetical protein Kow0026_21150 [Oricola sp.]
MQEPDSVLRAMPPASSPSIVLSWLDTTPAGWQDFRIHFIRKFRLPTSYLGVADLQRDMRMGDFEDSGFSWRCAQAHLEVRETRRVRQDVVWGSILGVRVGFDRIILPQKTESGPSRWHVSCTAVRIIPSLRDRTIPALRDDQDETILQLLCEGYSAKEIARRTAMSPRTVEHRISHLKQHYGARNVTHLVALRMGELPLPAGPS